MRLAQLIYLDAIIQHRSFHKAAAALHVSQPTLSEQMRELEEELGVRLLERSSAGAGPTEVGAQVHARIRDILAAVDDIHLMADRNRHTPLALGLIPTVLQWGCLADLPALVAGFDPPVRLQISQHGALRLADMVGAGELDVGCLTWTDSLSARFPKTVVEKLVPGRIVMAVAPGHPLATRSRVSLGELTNHPLTLFPEGYLMHEIIIRRLVEGGFRYQLLYYSENGSTLLETIHHGSAVGFLYELNSPGRPQRRDDLVRVPIDELDDAVWLAVAYHAGLRGYRGRVARQVARIMADILGNTGHHVERTAGSARS